MADAAEQRSLFAQRDVRITTAAFCGTLFVATLALSLNLLAQQTAPLVWFMCGAICAFTVASSIMLFLVIQNARIRLAIEDSKDTVASDFINRMIKQVNKRGDGWEVLLTTEGPIMRRRQERPTRLH